MLSFSRVIRAGRLLSAALVILIGLTGCLSVKSYVDATLPRVSKSDLTAPASPKPVQILFEFRSKGSANASATSQIRPRVVAVAAESGLFDGVAGAGEGGVLKVVIDNVPVTENAAAKGFGTGLTMGLAGSIVTDGYLCTMTYTRDGKTTETTVRHALHTTVGNKAGPAGLAPVTMVDGVNQVMDQLVWNGLRQLSEQGAF